MHPRRHSATLLILRSQALYATVAILVKLLAEDLRPLLITAWLMLIGPFLALLYCWLKKELKGVKQVSVPWSLARALVVLGNSALSFYGYSVLPLAEAAMLSFLTPLFLTILSWALLKEKVGWHRWGATIAGFIGVMVMVSPTLAPSTADLRHQLWGEAAMVLGAFCNAANYAILRRRLQTEVTSANIFLTSLWAGIAAAGVAWGPLVSTPLDSHMISGLLLLATVASLAVISNNEAYQRAEASYLAPFGYIQLFWVTLGGFVIWREMPSLQTWIGAALIIGGGVYTIRRERYWERRRRLESSQVF